MKSTRYLFAAFLATAGGCATPYEGQYAFGEGWREARVTEVGDENSLSHGATFDCRKHAPPKEVGFFARVEYPFSTRVKLAYIVRIRDRAEFRPGDLVYAKVGDCGVALIPRRSPSLN